MKQISTSFVALLRDDRGVTAIEYALIATMIAIAIVASVTAMGQRVNGMFESVIAGFQG